METLLPLIALCGVSGIVWVLGRPTVRVRTQRALRQARAIPIGGFPDGAISKVVGVVRYRGEPLRAPLSGRPCACYVVQVFEDDGLGGTLLLREVRMNDFIVEDQTGAAVVLAGAVDDAIMLDARFASHPFQPTSAAMETLLRRHKQSSLGAADTQRSLRYEEGVLEEGERVGVYGQGALRADAAAVCGAYRNDPRRLTISAPRGGSLLLTDEVSLL